MKQLLTGKSMKENTFFKEIFINFIIYIVLSFTLYLLFMLIKEGFLYMILGVNIFLFSSLYVLIFPVLSYLLVAIFCFIKTKLKPVILFIIPQFIALLPVCFLFFIRLVTPIQIKIGDNNSIELELLVISCTTSLIFGFLIRFKKWISLLKHY